MKPLSLYKDKLVATFQTAIVASLTWAGIFLVFLSANSHTISRGIASLADALMELHGTIAKMEVWVESMANNPKETQRHPEQSGRRADDGATSLAPHTQRRNAQRGQSQSLVFTPASPSPMVPFPVFTPSPTLLRASSQFTPLLRYDNSDSLSTKNSPALFSDMRAVPMNSTSIRALGVFPSLGTAQVTDPLTHRGHDYSIYTPRSTPPRFWQPAPKAHNVQLMAPDSARHRKIPHEEHEKHQQPRYLSTQHK